MKSKRANTLATHKLAARAAQRRRMLLAYLRSDHTAWLDQDHPELAAGTAAWVRKLRRESETRLRC